MINKFGQNMIYTELSDVHCDRATALADDDPAVIAILADFRASYDEITVSRRYLLSASSWRLP